MKKHFIYILFIGLFILSIGANQQVNPDEIIEINISKAKKNKKDLKLSELVKDVEILVLESNADCFMQFPYNLIHFGKKYILFHDNRQNQLYLFSRNGKFLRRIGRPGNGPGEYNRNAKIITSKDESRIVVSDFSSKRVIVYDVMGKVVIQKDLSKHFQNTHILELSCDLDNLITFVPHRPYNRQDGFSSLVLFDINLNNVQEVLPRPNDDNLICQNLRHVSLFANKEGSYFTEMYKDTVYQYYADGSSTPKYRFTIEKNKLTKDFMNDRQAGAGRNLYKHTFPMFVNMIPNYMTISASSLGTVYYNLKSGEVSLTNVVNDLCGISVGLNRYKPSQNLCVHQFRWGDYAKYNNLGKIRKMKVIHPEIRDQLIEYAENPSDDLGPVLVLMNMK